MIVAAADALAEDGRAITRIVVPFAEHPGFYSRNEFGAPVETGDGFYARTDDGGTLQLG